MSRQTGFTLTELSIALAIFSLLATLAVHSLRGALAGGHSAAERSALAETLAASFNQSTLSRQKVVVCASLDGTTCSGSLDWSPGWISFVDTDEDRERGANDPILRVRSRLKNGVLLRTSSGRTHIVFQPFGGVNAGTNVTFTFCDRHGAGRASTIVLANSGRMRTAAATAVQTAACLSLG